MSSSLERQVIAQVLETYVADQDPPIPVDWPNRVFEKPASGPWIRFTLMDQIGKQIEMGAFPYNTHRVYGTLILQLFVEADSGDGAALALGDALGYLYQQQILPFPDDPSSGHVRMRDPVVKLVGREDMYYHVNVSIPFHRDDILVS